MRMNEVIDKLENLTVVKRNGKKVDFDERKIAIAIKISDISMGETLGNTVLETKSAY